MTLTPCCSQIALEVSVEPSSITKISAVGCRDISWGSKASRFSASFKQGITMLRVGVLLTMFERVGLIKIVFDCLTFFVGKGFVLNSKKCLF